MYPLPVPTFAKSVLLLTLTLVFNLPSGLCQEYMIGADMSFLAQAEDRGRVFRDENEPTAGLKIFNQHGYNWIRLRLFHTPSRLPNNLDYTIAAAQDARRLGFKFLLNFHYSDTWADPGKQFIPKAWEGKTHEQLVDAVNQYSRDTIIAFKDAGVMPDMVQIGNEVIGGMLWPDGKVSNSWPKFADLVNAGVRGVEAGAAGGTRPPIMIHIDRGGDVAATKWFFDNCREFKIEFDVIGQSYYPWWHGSLLDLRQNLAFMATEYEKDIVLVEVAYHWRPGVYENNEGPFPETPVGQQAFLEEVNQIVMNAPHNRGKGIFWWEPAVSGGPIAGRGLFDDEGNALPAINVFDKFTRGKPSRKRE